MIRRVVAHLLARRTPTPPGMRTECEFDRVADRHHRAQDASCHDGEAAPFWCRACAHGSYHERCWKCRGRCWALELGRFNREPFDRRGIA